LAVNVRRARPAMTSGEEGSFPVAAPEYARLAGLRREYEDLRTR